MTFETLATATAREIGRPRTFVLATVICLAAIGAAFVPGWRETVNTWGGALTGYVSILLLIVLQNSTNREGAAQAAKQDEMIRVTRKARDELIGLERRSSEEIESLRGQL